METLPSAATEQRHLPHSRNNRAPSPWQSHRHQVRAIAKKLAATNDKFTCQKQGFMCALNGGLDAHSDMPCPAFTGKHTSVRTHHFEVQLLGSTSGRLHEIASSSLLKSRPVASAAAAATSISSGHRGGARRTSKRDRYTPADLDDDLTLAKSKEPMPCDDDSQNTAKAAVAATPARTSSVQTESADAVADKAEVAALYEKGLLYEDASPRGSGLTLDSIPHNEPYVIRPSKPRTRKPRGGRYSSDALSDGLNLSFSDLGDEGVVQALTAAADAAAAGDASSTVSSPTLRAIQKMEDASSEDWVVLGKEDA